MNVWGWYLTADQQRGIVYMPFGSPAGNYSGGDRPGNNLYGEYTYGAMESYRDFIDQVMPLLRSRGMVPEVPRGGTMRQRILGTDDSRLPTSHPGAAYRSR